MIDEGSPQRDDCRVEDIPGKEIQEEENPEPELKNQLEEES